MMTLAADLWHFYAGMCLANLDRAYVQWCVDLDGAGNTAWPACAVSRAVHNVLLVVFLSHSDALSLVLVAKRMTLSDPILRSRLIAKLALCGPGLT